MDIKVNDAEWKGLSKDEKAQIEAVVTAFFKGDRIVPDPSAARSAAPAAALAAAGNPICEAACNVAEAAAIAACNAIGNPIAKQLCILAAQEAGKLCRSKC